MNINGSPLEHLAAFAIVFVAGVVATLGIAKYIDKIRSDAQKTVNIKY